MIRLKTVWQFHAAYNSNNLSFTECNLRESGLRLSIYEVKRHRLKYINPEFFPGLRLGEDGMTECTRVVATFLRVANFEDQLHPHRIPDTEKAVRPRGVVREASSLREYNYLVRVKTSITLPKELLSRLDQVDTNRSALLERAALAYLARLEAEQRAQRAIAIINRNPPRLHPPPLDTLEY